jgi:hypothetical protein
MHSIKYSVLISLRLKIGFNSVLVEGRITFIAEFHQKNILRNIGQVGRVKVMTNQHLGQ